MRATFRPPTRICPRVAGSAQKTSRRRVVFPAPEGPVRNTNSPFSTVRFTSTSAGGSPGYALVTWNIWIIGSRCDWIVAERGPLGHGTTLSVPDSGIESPSMSDEFQFPEPEREQTPAPLPRQRSPLVLPWMVAGLAVVALGVVSAYAKKLIDDQAARAYQAMRMADEYVSRAKKLEDDQKDARRQAINSSEKTDELRAANTRLNEQATDKDAALTHLKDRHRQLVTDLRSAVRSSKGKALTKRIDRILAR